MALTIWRHFRVDVPDDWEMLLFSREMQAGRCVFADRYQHRLELSWQQVPGKPDFERMLSDYRAQLKAEQKAEDVESVEQGGWRGVTARVGGVLSSRFGRHLAGESCMVEVVFLWPDGRDECLERQVLGSVREEPADDAGRRRWRAFGMDALVSEGLSLRECVAQPGSARLVFGAGESGLRQERFERLGLVSHWLHVPLAEWLRRRLPREVAVREETTAVAAGHEVARLLGDRPVQGGARLLGRRARHEVQAWVCPADGRLYALTAVGAPEEPERAPRLTCCEAREKS